MEPTHKKHKKQTKHAKKKKIVKSNEKLIACAAPDMLEPVVLKCNQNLEVTLAGVKVIAKPVTST